MYEETTARKDRSIHDRLISFLLAMTMVLSCIVVGIPSFSLKAKAANGTTKFYIYQSGSLNEASNADAQAYVTAQSNKDYRYFASYKVPKRKEGRPSVGSDIFKVKTYVSGYSNNGTGSSGKHYFYADSQLTGIFGVTTPLDGGLRLISNTSIWHKQALTFSTATDESSMGKIDSDGFVLAIDENDDGSAGKSFFPDNLYTHWTLAQNWDIYNIKFAIKDYLSGKSFQYFGNASTGLTDATLRDGAVWIDSTPDNTSSYSQKAADDPKNIYVPTTNSEFKSNTNVGTNGKTEDIHPFLYMATATLPEGNSQTSPYDGPSLSLDIKGVDQYGVNYSAFTYSIAGVPSTVKINATTGKITGADNLTSTYKAIVTVTGKSRNTDIGSVTMKIPVYLGTTDSNTALKTRMNSWSNNAGQDADFGDAQFVATNESEYAYVNAQGNSKYTTYANLDVTPTLGSTTAGTRVRLFESANNGMVANGLTLSYPYTQITGSGSWPQTLITDLPDSSFPVGAYFVWSGLKARVNPYTLGVKVKNFSYFSDYSMLFAYNGANYALIEQNKNFGNVGGNDGTAHSIDVVGANSGDKINLYPFLYRYTLGGTLYSSANTTQNEPVFASSSVSVDNGVISYFDAVDVNAKGDYSVALKGVDQYGVNYSQSNFSYALCDANGSEISGDSFVSLSGSTLTVKDNLKNLPTDTATYMIKIFADTANKKSATNESTKTTTIYIPVVLHKEYQTYNVTFNLNGGNIDGNTANVVKTFKNDAYHSYGEFTSTVATPTKSNAVFVRWYESNKSGIDESATLSEENHTLTALWSNDESLADDPTYKTYTVNFYESKTSSTPFYTTTSLAGDPIFTDDVYEAWEKVYTNDDIEDYKGTKRFVGWDLNGSNSVSAVASDGIVTEGTTIKVYANFADEYKFNFYANGSDTPITVYLVKDELNNNIYTDYGYALPSVGQYVDFYGTVLKVNRPTNFNSVSEKDETETDANSYAWAIRNSTSNLKYKVDGIDVYLAENYTLLDKPATIKIPDISNGETGSYEIINAGSTFADIVGSSTKKEFDVYDAWKGDKHTLTFKKESTDTKAYTTIDGEYGSAVTPPTAPTKTGYTFSAWDPTVPTTMPSEDKTLVAQWTPNNYTITFIYNDGVTEKTTKKVTYDSPYGELPSSLTKTGFKFGGWYTENNGAGTKVEATTIYKIADNSTLYAYWIPISYRVKYNDNYSSPAHEVMDPTTFYYQLDSDQFLIANEFTRTGYDFIGWSKSNTATEATYANQANVNASANEGKVLTTTDGDIVVLYAVWSEKTATLTYNANGGSGAPAAQTLKYTEAATISTTEPTRAGYTFLGWSASNTATSATYEKGANYKAANVVPENNTLYAVWSEKTATLTYEANGGSGAPAAQTLKYTEAATISTTEPTRAGYTFLGWSASNTATSATYEKGANYKAANVVPENNTLYAVWTEKVESITYNKNAGTDEVTGMPATQTLNYADSATISTDVPVRTGYTFTGWNTQADGKGTSYAEGAAYKAANTDPKALNLYAQWTVNEYTVTFNAGEGATVSPTSKDVTYDSTYGTLPVPTKENYTFDGWFTDATAGTEINADSKVAITAAQTLYAHWTENDKHTATFNLNGGTSAAIDPIIQYEGLFITIPAAPSRTGYTFAGWKLNTNTVNPGDSYKMGESDVEFVAQWTANTYKVTFDKNGGDSVTEDSKDVTYDSTYGELPTASKTGYTFDGWFTDATEGTKVKSTDKVAITAAQTLYAHYTANTYTVKFAANGGTGTMDDQSFTYDVAHTLTANNFVKTGYTFDGWTLGETTYTDKKEVKNLASSGTVTLTAKWKANTYELTLDANGGNFEDATTSKIVTVKYDSTYGTLPEPATPKFGEAKYGYKFDGWYTSAGDDGTLVESTDIVDITEATTLYAHWSKNIIDPPTGIVATFEPATPDGSNNWYKTTVELVAPEGYKICLTQDGEYVDSIDMSNGDHTSTHVQYYLQRESDGAVTTAITAPAFKQDTVKPVINVADPTAASVTASQNAEVTVTTIGVSEVAKVQYRKKGTTEWKEMTLDSGKYTAQITENGEYEFKAVNNADVSSDIVTKEFENIDSVKPVIKVTATTKDGKDYDLTTSPWTNQDVTVTFKNAADNTSDVEFYVGTEKVTATEGKYTVTYTTTGTHTISDVTIRSAAGLVSDEVSATAKIDKVNPTGSVEVGKNNWTTFVAAIDVFNIFFKEPVQVKLGTADADSGVKSKYYIVKDAGLSVTEISALTTWEPYPESGKFMIDKPDGNKIVYLRIEDNAGNIAYVSSEGMLMDTVVPEVKSTPSFKEGEWTTGSISIKIDSIIDPSPASGVKAGTISYAYVDVDKDRVSVTSVDENNGFTISGNDAFPTGDYKIIVSATDNAGNTGTQTINVKYEDEDAVVITSPIDKTVTYGDASATFTVKAVSHGSELQTIAWEYSTDNGVTWTQLISPKAFTGEDNLVVNNPTVVNDDGTMYRAKIETAAHSGDNAIPTTPAKLTVNQKVIKITPDTQKHKYGTAGSQVVSGLSWNYVASNTPLGADEDTITDAIIGQFVRNKGVTPDTYIITSDTGDKAIRLNTSVPLTGNYLLKVEPSESKFVITTYDPGSDVKATLAGEKPNGWFIKDSDGDGVRITAPTNYLISTSDSVENTNTWASYITVDDGEYNDGYTYYLKYTGEGELKDAISVAKTTEAFKQDTVAPTATLKVDESYSWIELLNTITFNIFKKDTVDVAVNPNDVTSGVKTTEWFITNEVQSNVTNISGWSTDTSKLSIPAKDKDNKDKFIVYARVTDNAGNVAYFSTNGVVFDTTSPEITVSGKEKNTTAMDTETTAYGDRLVTFSDENLDTVTVKIGDAEPVALTADEIKDGYSLDNATKETYVFVVTDKAGNSVERTVSVDTVADFIEELDDTWVDTQEPPQPRDPSAEEIREAIKKIDDLLEKETSDEDSNLTDEEIAALNEKKNALNAVLEQGEEFIKNYLVEDSSTYPDNEDSVYDKATDSNFKQIISGKDAYDALPQAAKDVINEAIKNSEYSDSTIDNYLDLLDAAADKALEKAKQEAENVPVNIDDLLPDEPATTEDKLDAVEEIEQRIAEKFVSDYASNGDATNPYNTTDNKITTPGGTDNSEKVASGADKYNGYSDGIQDKIDKLIAQPDTDGKPGEGNYPSYPEMLKDASDDLLNKELKEANEILEEMRDDTDADLPDEKTTDVLEDDIETIIEKAKEDISKIDPADSEAIEKILENAKDAIDTIIAREFVENYASNNNSNDPYEDKDPGTNLIDTPTEADRVTAGNDPYKHVNDNVKDKINELIAQPDGSGDPEDGNYASYPDMLKDAAKQDLDDAINEAKELINDMYENGDLTEEERDTHLQEIDDIANADPTPTTADQMIERKDAIEEKAAEIFVDEYASKPDHTTPYTKPEGDNPIPDGNNNQVVNGKEPFENTSKGIQDKIDDLIAQPGTDGEPEDGNYPSYKDMLDDAIVPSLSETVSDVEKLINEMVEQGDLTQDEANALKQEIEEIAENALEEPIDLENVLAAKEAIEDIGAETFIKEYASNNDPDKPYNKDDNKIDTQDKADKVTDGSDIFNGNKPEGTYDPLPDYLKDKINDKISDPDGDGTKDSTKDYVSYPEMLADAAKKALDEAKKTAEEILNEMVENGDITEEEKEEVLGEIQDIIDSLPDPASTEKIIDAKNAINDTLADEFVKTYASDDDGVYDKDGNKIDGADDAEKVISGSDVYDDLPESVKDMVNDKISDPDGDGTKDSTKDYESYSEMLDAALKEKADEAKQQIKDINNDPNADNQGTKDAIEKIDEILSDPNMTSEKKKEAIDKVVADEFIKNYASDNNTSDPYDKTESNGVTSENADQILAGNTDPDGTGDKKSPYDSLTSEQQKLVNDKIATPTSDPVEETYSDYPAMVEAAKNQVEADKANTKDAIDKAAKEAKDAINALDGLSEDEKNALKSDVDKAATAAKEAIDNATTESGINKALDDGKKAINDVADLATAQDFVNKYASGSDNDPYDKTDDKLNLDNIKQVVSGKDVYNSLPGSVKKKINEIISTPTGDETTYPSYSDMLNDAQTIAKNISDANDIRVDVKVDGLMEFNNANATSVSDIKNILAKSIDSDDIDVMLAGGRVSIVMTIKEITDDELNSAAISADGLKLYKHVEITIVKTQYDKNDKVIGSENITKTAEPISFVVSVADIQKDGRVFYVYADHTGKTKAEKTADGDGVLLSSTVEFETADFSVFSIAYVDDSPIEEIVNTLDESPIITMFTTFGLSALMFVATKKKKEEIEGEMN